MGRLGQIVIIGLISVQFQLNLPTGTELDKNHKQARKQTYKVTEPLLELLVAAKNKTTINQTDNVTSSMN